jgi:hypothetical protein
MRNMALIAIGMTLASPAAQAGQTRSLTLSTGETVATSRPADSQRTADANPPAMARPATPPAQAAPAPAQIAPQIVSTEPSARWQSARAPQRRHTVRASRRQGSGWTKSRIVSELHRHGIYW